MKTIAEEQRKIKFSDVLDQLTDENQQEILGVLEGLYFVHIMDNNVIEEERML